MKRILFIVAILLISMSCISCNMEILGVAISSSENVHSVTVGENLQLTATVYPVNYSQEVTWSSLDDRIASVDASGLVTGVSAGKTSIVATAKENMMIKQSFAIIVEKGLETTINPESVTVSSVNGQTSFKVGQTLSLSAIVLPRDASQSVRWASSDINIATVSRGDVRAIKTGIVTITAFARGNDEVYGSITLTIEAQDKPVVSPEWTNMAFSTHNDYVNNEDDSKLKIKGVVTHVCPVDEDTVSYFIQSGRDGYYVYAQNALLYPVEIGKVYEVGGYKKYYKGLNEIVNVEYFIESDEDITFDYVSIDGTNPTDVTAMKEYQAAYIKTTGTYVSGDLKDSSAFNVTVKINGYDTTLRIDPNYCESDEFTKIYNLFASSIPGTKIELCGFMTAFGWGTPATQIQITKASDLTIEKASDKTILETCLLQIKIANSVGFSKDSIALPTKIAGFDDVLLIWKSSNELINVDTMKVNHSDKDVVVTLTVTLKLNEEQISKDFEVKVEAKDDKVYEVLRLFDLEDALPANQYGCSDTKPGYAAAVVSLGTPKSDWLLQNALIACSSSDKYDGTMGIRAKAGYEAASTARIEIKESGEYNVVEFDAATYGNHVLGTQIRIEYTTNDGSTWVAVDEIITLNSYTLETFRVKLPEGNKRVAIVVVENSGKTINIDNIKLMK